MQLDKMNGRSEKWKNEVDTKQEKISNLEEKLKAPQLQLKERESG